MRLDSALELKRQLLNEVVVPFAVRASRLRRAGATAVWSASAAGGFDPAETVFGVGARPFARLPAVQRSVALGVARRDSDYRLAVRVQRPSLMQGPIVERLVRRAKGEVDVRLVGRVDKRTRAARVALRHRSLVAVATAARPWYQLDTRPLLIGASVGHVEVTAGTIGGFVRRGDRSCLLSNNHVLANEDQAKSGNWILQRARYDGGRQPASQVARLGFWVRLKKSSTNFVDAAIGKIEPGIDFDAARLREIVAGADRALAGLGPELIDEGDVVYKVGRTTGPTRGRITAFDVDNLVVRYDVGNLRFDNQVEIEGTGMQSFSDGGDSGSLIVNGGMEAIALLFAGGDSGGSNGLGLTYANPIHRVLKELKATLLS
jgi:hypothetical protein